MLSGYLRFAGRQAKFFGDSANHSSLAGRTVKNFNRASMASR